MFVVLVLEFVELSVLLILNALFLDMKMHNSRRTNVLLQSLQG